MNRQSSDFNNRESNQELQEQELACLTSLLKEEEFHQLTPRSGKLDIFPLLDPPITIFVVPDGQLGVVLDHLRSQQLENHSSKISVGGLAATEFPGSSCPLSHLPSIELDFWYPENYPSEEPPKIRLSCPWITQNTLDLLEHSIKNLWGKNGRLAVLYDAFLHLNSITSNREIFPLGNVLLIVPAGGNGAMLSRTDANVLPFSDPSDALATLSFYDRQRAEHIFQRSPQQCPVCLVTRIGLEFISLRNCQNYCCRECMENTCALNISEGTLKLIRCLVCGIEAHPLDVSSCVSEDLFAKYQHLQLNAALFAMRDVAYCPRPRCSQPVIVDMNSNVGRCHCGYLFCILCNGSPHGDIPCGGTTARVYDEKKLQEQLRVEALDREYLRHRLHNMIADDANGEQGIQNTKHCPGCRCAVQKSEGCDHMCCSICSTNFCWRCLCVGEHKKPCRDEALDLAADQVIAEIMHLPRPEQWDDLQFMEEQASVVADRAREARLSALQKKPPRRNFKFVPLERPVLTNRRARLPKLTF